jgi:4-hydroxy-tetrahydrodipicolinate synthase
MGGGSGGHYSNPRGARALRGGLYASVVTSRRNGGGRPNLDATARIAEWVCGRGVDGISVLGMAGEFMDYGPAERLAVTRSVVRAARCPVMVNAAHTTLEGAVELGRAAAGEGAAAVIVMPPPVFHRAPMDVREFLLRFGEQMKGRAPLILYNLPRVSDWIPYETAEELLASGLYAGMKDASGEAKYFERLAKLKSLVTYLLFAGNDATAAQGMRRGADGAVSACAGAVPELMVALWRAIRAGNGEAAADCEARLGSYLEWLEKLPGVEGIRETLAERCFNVGPEGTPIGAANQAKLAAFREWLTGWLTGLPEAGAVASLGV